MGDSRGARIHNRYNKEGLVKILIYGSTYLTSRCIRKIWQRHSLVGQVPSINPFIQGKLWCRAVHLDDLPEHDIKLSIQYNRKIPDCENGFNVHTGLLPEWGGCDVLYHTLRMGATKQGATFHKMTDILDQGPVISKMTYPVLPGDTVLDLYARLAVMLPSFVVGALKILEDIGLDAVDYCDFDAPTMFKRGAILEEHMESYEWMGRILQTKYGVEAQDE